MKQYYVIFVPHRCLEGELKDLNKNIMRKFTEKIRTQFNKQEDQIFYFDIQGVRHAVLEDEIEAFDKFRKEYKIKYYPHWNDYSIK